MGEDNNKLPPSKPLEGEVVDYPECSKILVYGDEGYLIRGKLMTSEEINPEKPFPDPYQVKPGESWVYIPKETMQEFLTAKGKCGRWVTLKNALESILKNEETTKRILNAIIQDDLEI